MHKCGTSVYTASQPTANELEIMLEKISLDAHPVSLVVCSWRIGPMYSIYSGISSIVMNDENDMLYWETKELKHFYSRPTSPCVPMLLLIQKYIKIRFA